MAKDPAFLFYPGDWLGGTIGMTFEEKGAYMELLMLQFNRGHMTSHMIGQTVGQMWDNLKVKFIQDKDGLWYNERLEIEVEKRKTFTKSRKNNLSGKNQYTKKDAHMRGHISGHMTSHMENENENNNRNSIEIENSNFQNFREFSFEETKKILLEESQIWHDQLKMSDSRIQSDQQLKDIITKWLLKQNSTGSYFPVSIDNVRRHFAHSLPKMEIESIPGFTANNRLTEVWV